MSTQDIVTVKMLRAAQFKSELGAIAISDMLCGYNLITELFEVMYTAMQAEQNNS